jgi:hypothetical protein
MEIELNPRWRPNTETNGHLSPRSETNIHHMTSSQPTLFFITHYLQHLITEEIVLFTLQRHCTENAKEIFPEMKLCSVSFLGIHKSDLLCRVDGKNAISF